MKKGQLELMSEYVIHFILLLLVIIPFVSVSYKIKDNNLHLLRVEAKDYSFTRDTISINSKIDYNYELKKNIILSIDKDKCSLKLDYENKNIPLIYSCTKLSNIQEENLNNIIKIKNV